MSNDSLDNVPPALLQQMVIYNNHKANGTEESPVVVTVGSLSKNHKVLLIFLRHFQCVFCQATICKVATHYKTLLQLNTIPVLVHQESEEYGNEYFSTYKPFEPYQPIVNQIMRVSALGVSTTTTTTTTNNNNHNTRFYSQFELGKTSLNTAPILSVAINAQKLTRRGFSNSLTPRERSASRSQMPGMFIVENNEIKNIYKYSSIAENPLFLELVIDVEEKGSCSESFCDLSGGINAFSIKRNNNNNSSKQILNQELPAASEAHRDEVATSPSLAVVELHDNIIDNEETTDETRPLYPQFEDPYKVIAPKTSRSTRSSRPGLFYGCFGNDPSATAMNIELLEEVKNSISIASILNNDKARKYFKLFCASEFSIENILFWEAVQMYHSKFKSDLDGKQILPYNQEEVTIMATQIIQTFFQRDAPNELNTSRKRVTDCTTRLMENGPTVDLFDEIQKDIVAEPLSDTFIRFRKTDDFNLAASIVIKKE